MEKENVDPDLNDFQAPKKKRRFKEPASEEEMKVISKGFVPKNTQKSTAWAYNVFVEWMCERNNSSPPGNLLDTPDPIKLNRWLSRFVTEVRKKDGSPYPPRSIHLILSALQRKMLETNPSAPTFFDKGSPLFAELRIVCDYTYRELHSDGVGCEVKHTRTFSSDEEDKLWESVIIGVDTPKSLQFAVFFYVGKFFCLRGGEEQRRLGPSNFIRSSDPDCYTYLEHGSKNRSGGLAELRVENKAVPCYAVPDQSPRCLVYLLDRYLGKLPCFAFANDVFYCRPKAVVPANEHAPWYEGAPVGKNKLASMVKEMCISAGIDVKTNHSLRATGATNLFQSNVPKKIIQGVTGHRSLDSLRQYEKSSVKQLQAVSKVMMSSEPLLYEEEINQVSTATSSSVALSQTKKTEAFTSFCLTPSDGVRSVFGNLSNCSIGHVTINMHSGGLNKDQ